MTSSLSKWQANPFIPSLNPAKLFVVQLGFFIFQPTGQCERQTWVMKSVWREEWRCFKTFQTPDLHFFTHKFSPLKLWDWYRTCTVSKHAMWLASLAPSEKPKSNLFLCGSFATCRSASASDFCCHEFFAADWNIFIGIALSLIPSIFLSFDKGPCEKKCVSYLRHSC